MFATDRPVADRPHPAGEGGGLAEDGGHVARVPRHELRHAAARAAEAAEVWAGVGRVAVVDVAQLQRGAAAAAGHHRGCTEGGSFHTAAIFPECECDKGLFCDVIQGMRTRLSDWHHTYTIHSLLLIKLNMNVEFPDFPYLLSNLITVNLTS